jgi:hypothetical protein
VPALFIVIAILIGVAAADQFANLDMIERLTRVVLR